MKFTAIFTALIGTAAMVAANPLFERAAKCDADNCARAVGGTAKPAGTTKLADCASFFKTTVTPAPVFSTIYVDSPVPVRIGIVIPKKPVTVIPSNVPAYATACSGTVRYSSACSCVGATAATFTAATPTYTVTKAAPTVTAV